jgi:hypothetical protein
MKNFIFDCESLVFCLFTVPFNFLKLASEICALDEPHEWAYSTDGKGNTFIDITDDTTGQIHDLARQHTSVYVNEVGHASNLHENV